ncbi:MAG: hypothetical protein N3A71_00780 [Candidatus Dojkabacteria bacterium]|nr:hypothetical protein [Candidatus Dojkabacteria bacterium]
MLIKKVNKINLRRNVIIISFISLFLGISIISLLNNNSQTLAMMSNPVDNRKPIPSPTHTSRPSPTPTPTSKPTPTFRPNVVKPTIVKPTTARPTPKPSPRPTRKPYRTSDIFMDTKDAKIAKITVNNTNIVI